MRLFLITDNLYFKAPDKKFYPLNKLSKQIYEASSNLT